VSWFYRRMIRPILFAQDSEKVHQRTLAALGFVSRHRLLCRPVAAACSGPRLPIELFGLTFPNPVGLAAGMDKFARAVPVWEAMGFGFCELGGVTWHPQPGNPCPRLFRAVADQALINRMGFNNPGAAATAEILDRWKRSGLWPNHPVGINLGKSKITPLEDAAEDYSNSFRMLRSYGDFFVVNVSSPNTPNLRQLQDKAALNEILCALQEQNSAGAGLGTRPAERSKPRPILVKVAPDLSFEALDEILELCASHNLAGIVATNTTVERPQAAGGSLKQIYAESGGLSGRPLRERSTQIVSHIYRQSRGKLPIIGVGGILDAADAWEKVAAGASLVQIYTGLIYEGPTLAKEVVAGVRTRMSERGLTEWRQAVGLGHRDQSEAGCGKNRPPARVAE
jgi:dihydroorotate dehydrogenase